MNLDYSIQREKLAQAVSILQERDLDMWLIFVRETMLNPDPCLDLILGHDLTWQSALIITRNNERVAIVGRYDADNVRQVGGYTQIIGYDENLTPHLRNVIGQINPRRIGVNFSENDVSADGLSYGMWLLLNNMLADTPYKHRLVTAEHVIGSLRGRKTPSEVERVRLAVKTTEAIVRGLTVQLKTGMSATTIYDLVNDEMRKRGVSPAWSPCPMVVPGPDAPVGHVAPEEQYQTHAGHLLHIDLGVAQNSYMSDMQRVWYFKRKGETEIPAEVRKGFEAVRGAIQAAAAMLKPGVKGWEVDAVAREYIVKQGYAEYKHALGHHLGRSAHDGATVLGPRWPKYGKLPEGVVEAGNIFTLEPHVVVPGYGTVGLEEDVLVTEQGVEWLSLPQTELMVIESE
jgi:Xaa-Pro aminopeptidase